MSQRETALKYLRNPRSIPLMPLIWVCVYAGVILIVIAALFKQKYSLALLPGLGILGLFFLWTRPQLTYYGILVFVPFDAYRSLLGGSFTISKLLGVLAIGIVGVNIIMNKHKTFKITSNLWGPIGGLFFVAILSAMFSDYPQVSWDNIRKLTIALIFFVMTLYFIKERDLFVYMPAVVVVGTSISAGLAVYGYVSGDANFAMDVGSDVSISRGTGTANDPNIFAMSLLFAYPVIANIALNARHYQYRAIAIVFLFNNLAAIIVTFSRGAALVFMICTILFFSEHIRRFKPKYLGFLLVGIGVILSAAVVLVPSSYWDRQKSLTDSQDTSLSRRRSYITVAKAALSEKPLLGFGPGTFKEYYATTKIAAQHARRRQKDFRRYAHNTYLEVAVGLGGAGFTMFMALILTAYRDFGRARKIFLDKGWAYEAGFCLGFRVGLVGLSCNFLFLSNLYSKYFWMALAVAQLCLNYAETREIRKPGQKGPMGLKPILKTRRQLRS